VFEALRTACDSSERIALHSLGFSSAWTGEFGEIDFVVIIPRVGIICVEVKGGAVAHKEGIWTTRRYDAPTGETLGHLEKFLSSSPRAFSMLSAGWRRSAPRRSAGDDQEDCAMGGFSRGHRGGDGGRKPYDTILKFKIVVLQSLHNLSDEQTGSRTRWAARSCAPSASCGRGSRSG
jgi:Nuclease-related domain